MAADSTGCIPDLTRTLSSGCQIESWRVPDRATDTLMKGWYLRFPRFSGHVVCGA